MLVLSVFETPAWCGQQSHSLFGDAGARCSESPGGDDILLSGVPYIPLGWGLIIELVILYFISKKFRLERAVQLEYFETMTPKQEYYNLKGINFGLACVAFEVLDMVFFVAFRPRFRLAFLARTGYLFLLPAVLNLSQLVYSCLWEFFSIASFLIGTILLFAWIAVMIFQDMSLGAKGFHSFSSALYSMFVAGVSAEFLTTFLESYTTHRWVGLLWLVFLVIVHVLLLSLVLDTLTAAYMTYSEKYAEEEAEHKVKGILKAFRVIAEVTDSPNSSDNPEVTKKGFIAFIKEYSLSPKVVPMSEDKASIMFMAIDKDGSGLIDYEEFCGICRVIQYKVWCTRKDSFLATWCPALWDSGRFRRFRRFVVGEGGQHSQRAGLSISDMVHSSEDHLTSEDQASGPEQSAGIPGLERWMNVVLIVNLSLVVLETAYDLSKVPEPPMFEFLELVFSLVYLGEVMCKLSVVSFGEYWAFTSNQFDFFSTWLLLSTSVIERLFSGNLSTYANMLRLLRLLRVVKNLKNVDSVQFMVKTISKLLLTAKDMVILLGVVVFFFTLLSVQLVGGELYVGNKKLEGSEYLEEHMAVLNCNDVPCAFGLWVVMLLSEYVPNFPDAVSRVSHVPGTWIIFPIFYVCGVSIVFELVKAFTIEVFITLFRERARKEVKHEDAFERCLHVFRQALDKRGENLHYRESGNESQQLAIQEALERLVHKAEKRKKHSYRGSTIDLMLMHGEDPASPAKKHHH
uniref:EF-hand domain-containing protein n=1 Tax=Zooxanthella nutricula TaxID=1333877 RepID=A0A7S2I652_9DINO